MSIEQHNLCKGRAIKPSDSFRGWDRPSGRTSKGDGRRMLWMGSSLLLTMCNKVTSCVRVSVCVCVSTQTRGWRSWKLLQLHWPCLVTIWKRTKIIKRETRCLLAQSPSVSLSSITHRSFDTPCNSVYSSMKFSHSPPSLLLALFYYSRLSRDFCFAS